MLIMNEKEGKMQEFKRRFKFSTEGSSLVGVERECFLTNESGRIMPLAVKVLSWLADRGRFGYELSACQLEDRIGPVALDGLEVSIAANEMIIKMAEAKLGFRRLFAEVGPEDLPLDVYPDPTGRYQQIAETLPPEILKAACQVTGTHIHVGMPDYETALTVYNAVIGETDRLCQMGDNSGGERLRIYAQMAPEWRPQPYINWDEFHAVAKEKGFETDPRKCWSLIRISVHGTIEFRMFGSIDNYLTVVRWAKECHRLCADAMK